MQSHKLMEEAKADGTPAGGQTVAPPVETNAPAPDAAKPAPKVDDSASLSSPDFANIAEEDLGEGVEGAPEDSAPVQHPPVKAVPAKPVVEAPKPAESVVEEPAKPVVTPPASAEPAKPAVVVEPPKEPVKPAPTEAELQTQIAAERKKFFDSLTERYAITDEQAAQFITEPEKVLPGLLAKAHMEAVDHVAKWISQQLPNMLNGLRTAQEQQAAYVKQFFDEWPELNKPEFAPTVARVLTGFRAANKDAKPEDVIREGGVSALVALRLPIPDRVLKSNNAHQPNAQKPAAFQPVGGTRVARPAPQPSNNEFTVIAQEDVEEGA